MCLRKSGTRKDAAPAASPDGHFVKKTRSVETNRKKDGDLEVIGCTPYSVGKVAKCAFQLLEFFWGEVCFLAVAVPPVKFVV